MTPEQMTKWIAKQQMAAMEATLANLRNAMKSAGPLRDIGEGWELCDRLEEMAGQVERMMVEHQGYIAAMNQPEEA